MKGHGILDVPSNSNSPLPPLISSHLLDISVVLVTVSGTQLCGNRIWFSSFYTQSDFCIKLALEQIAKDFFTKAFVS
jgi:hypothetical protein